MTGHTSVYRGLSYILSQVVGATLGSCLMRFMNDTHADAQAEIDDITGLCSRGDVGIMPAFVAEVMCFYILVNIAYGVAIDPRQGKLFGPIVAPMFVSCVPPTIGYSVSRLGNGFGPGMNWANCIGSSVAAGHFSLDLFLYPVAHTLAACAATYLYMVHPPHGNLCAAGTYIPPLLAAAYDAHEDDGESADIETETSAMLDPEISNA